MQEEMETIIIKVITSPKQRREEEGGQAKHTAASAEALWRCGLTIKEETTMKKVICMGLALAMAFSMVACGGSS